MAFPTTEVSMTSDVLQNDRTAGHGTYGVEIS